MAKSTNNNPKRSAPKSNNLFNPNVSDKCKRQVKRNNFSQIRFNTCPQLRLNRFRFKNRFSLFHPDAISLVIKSQDLAFMKQPVQNGGRSCRIFEELPPIHQDPYLR